MRVTDARMFEAASKYSGQAREQVDRAITEVSSGRRLQRPSDDAIASGRAVTTGIDLQRTEAFLATASSVLDELTTAESALSGVTNAFARAHELAVQMANDTLTAAQRANAALEVRALKDQVVSSLNSRFGSRYLFGGNKDAAPPFDANGAYLGDDGQRQVEIAPGVFQAASIRVDQYVQGVGGGSDVLASLEVFAAALEANDSAGINASVDGVNAAREQIVRARTELGGQINTFQAAATLGRTLRDEGKKQLSALVETDPIEAATRLALAQRALEASLAAASQGFKQSLLDYLR